MNLHIEVFYTEGPNAGQPRLGNDERQGRYTQRQAQRILRTIAASPLKAVTTHPGPLLFRAVDDSGKVVKAFIKAQDPGVMA